jgi:cell division protein DivIC
MSAGDEALARPRLRLSGRAVALAALVLLLVAAGAGVFRQFLAQRARIDRLERQVEVLEAERTRLERRIGLLNDPEHLERLARRCLGMVRPGEILFVVPEEKPDGTNVPSAC